MSRIFYFNAISFKNVSKIKTFTEKQKTKRICHQQTCTVENVKGNNSDGR